MFYNKGNNRIRQVPVNLIKPNKAQPRQEFISSELECLSKSIKENGILQPLTVRKNSSNEYELIAGERRLRASLLAGLKEVPCILVNCDDGQSAVFALLENIQRSDLNVFEEAEGIYKLINEQGLTQEEVAIKLGKKQSTVANKLRLLKLTKEERKRITEANLTERHARALLRLKSLDARNNILDTVIKKQLNVQQTELLIDAIIEEDKEKVSKNRRVIIKDVRIFINTIDKAVLMMKTSGIEAISENHESEKYLEYVIKIPKKSAFKEKLA